MKPLRQRRPPQAFWFLLALVAVFAATAPGFLSGGNLSNVGRTGAALALAACGQAIVIVTGGLDLSAPSAVALMSVVTALTVDYGTVPAMALGAAVVVAAGVVNGLLVALFAIPPFLVTLGTFTALHGIASILAGGIPLEAPPGGAFSWPANGRVGPVPVPVLAALAGIALLWLLFRRTSLGRAWFLVGSNRAAARAAGIRVTRSLFLAYVCAAGFVALAGVILTSRVHSGQPDLYPTLAFEAIAACAIGGFAMSGGVGSAERVLIGVAVVACVSNGLVLLNFSSSIQLIATGALTVLAVVAQRQPAPRLLRLRRRAAADPATPAAPEVPS